MIFKQAQEKITDIILHLTHDLKASLIEVEESDYEGNSYTQKFHYAFDLIFQTKPKKTHLNTGLFCDIENRTFFYRKAAKEMSLLNPDLHKVGLFLIIMKLSEIG